VSETTVSGGAGNIKLYVALVSATAETKWRQLLRQYCVLLVLFFDFITLLLPISSALFLESRYGALKFIRQYNNSDIMKFSISFKPSAPIVPQAYRTRRIVISIHS
jgi:hypothetical protein